MTPPNIQVTARIMEIGVLSPYPPVVMEVELHHVPSNHPKKNEVESSSGLVFLSQSQAMKPAIDDIMVHNSSKGRYLTHR